MTEPHQLLGVRVGATRAEIRRAFASKARDIHPDTAAGTPQAGEELAALVRARDRLLSPAGPAPVTVYRKPRGLKAVATYLWRKWR